MIEREASAGYLSVAAGILATRFEEILDAYERLLLEMKSPLVAEAETREQLRANARSTLEEIVRSLRSPEREPASFQSAEQPETTGGVSTAGGNVHTSESLRAVTAFSEAALSVVVDNLPPSPTSRKEVAAVALTMQKIIMEHAARSGIAYVNYLLKKVHESHADERRRISRELHDRVAHSIMVAFRNLEIFEIYKTKDPSKAQTRLELAKTTTQEALELTRSLSRELREMSAEEGLEVALSELLSISVPQNVRSRVAVEGDERLVAPQVRDELFLIVREGVRNAAKHSRASTIDVRIDIAESRVKATVVDNGSGFSKSEPLAGPADRLTDGGTGLTSMRERASLLGGTLYLESAPGEGTKLEVFVPLPRSRG